MQISDELVEKAARAHMEAAWADMRERGLQPRWTWERMDEAAKENIKHRERKVLEAVWEAIIERAAKAMYDRDEAAAAHPGFAIPWDEAHPANRDYWREMAREALSAALGGDEGADNAGDD